VPLPYAQTTLAQARGQLSDRLQDNGIFPGTAANTYWPELNIYIVEALRTWQALTAFYRQRGAFQTEAGTAFYDLTTVLPPGIFDRTVTVANIVSEILYYLIEPQLDSGGNYVGSDQFTLSGILSAIQRRRDRFLQDTGRAVTHVVQSLTAPPPVGRIPLAQNTVDVRRVAWNSLPLWRQDEFAMNSFLGNWNQNATVPRAFSVSVTPPLSLQVAPVPLNAGILDLCVVQSGAVLNSSNLNTPLGIQDDFCWVVVYGALSDLLSEDGQSRDPVRAGYCEQRYTQGVEIAKMNPSGLLIQINNIPMNMGSVFDMDAFLGSWQAVPGPPRFAGFAGHTLLALGPNPNGIYGVTMDLAGNIPVPLSDGDYLQVGQEDLAYVLDYGQHLASFKMGGAEFDGSMKLLKNFYAGAVVRNARLKGTTVDKFDLELPGIKQSMEYARTEESEEVEVNA
jgi:hypothetical protein